MGKFSDLIPITWTRMTTLTGNSTLFLALIRQGFYCLFTKKIYPPRDIISAK
ncbi:MAG: hypothetical protein HS129_05405 [Leptospiraceae bacterium]|nr:hypothetical protein [Leptospiraceae bacterium]